MKRYQLEKEVSHLRIMSLNPRRRKKARQWLNQHRVQSMQRQVWLHPDIAITELQQDIFVPPAMN